MTRDELKLYIFETYSTSPDMPWPDSPEDEVFRHSSNRKWFALCPAYHMNKDKWISAVISDADEELLKTVLDMSFELTAPKIKRKRKDNQGE